MILQVCCKQLHFHKEEEGNGGQKVIFPKEGKKILNLGAVPGLFPQLVSAYGHNNAYDSEGE